MNGLSATGPFFKAGQFRYIFVVLFPAPVMESPSEAPTKPGLSQDPASDVQKSSQEGGVESPDPKPAATFPGPDIDLMDPNRYCSLCAASFNNPQMALQHYNGRKHQRNQSRYELLKELGNKVQQGNTLSDPGFRCSAFVCLFFPGFHSGRKKWRIININIWVFFTLY